MTLTYTIGISSDNTSAVDEAQIFGAIRTLREVANVKRRTEAVRYIKAENGRPMSEWELVQEARTEEPF